MDVRKRLDGMRMSEKEWNEVVDVALEKISPATDADLQLVRFWDLFQDAKVIADKGNVLQGLATGYNNINSMTMGLVGGDIIIVYGYTSMGKSQLSQNIALNVAKEGNAVLFIGLELTNKQNAARFIKMGADDPSLPFIFPEKADLRYTDIQPAIKKAVRDDECKLVVVDQLQDLIHSTTNEQAEITQIMAELKRAAIACDVPIIVVSHINRVGAGHAGPPPLETLKGSASIEQKCDIAIGVWRDTDANIGDVEFSIMQVKLTKNRQRGKNMIYSELHVEKNMRLTEMIR